MKKKHPAKLLVLLLLCCVLCYVCCVPTSKKPHCKPLAATQSHTHTAINTNIHFYAQIIRIVENKIEKRK